MGVVRGAEGAQECQVLLKLGQGRTFSKGLLDLACISVLGSHSHHLRDIEHARDAARLARERAAEPPVATSCTQRRRIARDGRSQIQTRRSSPQYGGPGPDRAPHRRDRLAQVPVRGGPPDAVVTAGASGASMVAEPPGPGSPQPNWISPPTERNASTRSPT